MSYMSTVREGQLGMLAAHHWAAEEPLARLLLPLIARPPPDLHNGLLRLAEYKTMAGFGGSFLNVQCNTYP